VEHGIVTRKWFLEQVRLPVRVWYLRDGAYVPDLAVSSRESTQLPNIKGYPRPDPYRMARNMRGPYGVVVWFMPQEESDEKAALMNFRFSCITRFSPCLREDEILPEGWRILQETQLIY
jgi:hypothetical protein